MPTFDWMHILALVAGAAATTFFPRKSPANPSSNSPNSSTTSQHPLFDTLVQVLESKLTDLISVEPGPDGAPIFTLRVILASDTPHDAKPAASPVK
jgi:hypothetical protein